MIHITNPLPSQRQAYHELNRRPSVLFQNIFVGNLAAPENGQAGFPRVNATDGKTNTGWIHGTVAQPFGSYATVTDLPEQPLDCLCIAAHTLGTLNATIRAQAFTSGSWSNVSDSVVVTDDSTIMLIFPRVLATGVRLYITGAVQPFIGVISAGLRLVFKPLAVLPYNPLHLSEDVEMLTNRSGNGNHLGSRVKRRGLRGSIRFALTDHEWAMRNVDPFRRHYNDGGAFFFAPAPELFQQDIVYCWREGNTMVPEFVVGRGSASRVQLSMEVRGFNAR